MKIAVHSLQSVCNSFYQDDKSVYCCEDNTVKSVGSDSKEGQMSPRRMLTSTIGDELQVATDFRSKVIGVALKDRASILPAGHAADAAYWWDTSAGRFVSSTFYMDKLPQWVEVFYSLFIIPSACWNAVLTHVVVVVILFF